VIGVQIPAETAHVVDVQNQALFGILVSYSSGPPLQPIGAAVKTAVRWSGAFGEMERLGLGSHYGGLRPCRKCLDGEIGY